MYREQTIARGLVGGQVGEMETRVTDFVRGMRDCRGEYGIAGWLAQAGWRVPANTCQASADLANRLSSM